MAESSYKAGVKEYREKYWTPDYVPLDTDLLACFKVTGQPEVQAGIAILCMIDNVTAFAQAPGQVAGDFLVIFDKQNVHTVSY